MKSFLILFVFYLPAVFAQSIFPYEKDFENKSDKDFMDVEFYDSINNAMIRGTLIIPKKEFNKVVIIIPGSGKDTRYSHFDLAENLVDNGIAVYRFDELGVGQSEGKYSSSVKSLITSTKYALHRLKDLDITKNKKIGLLGHSLGGMATIKVYNDYPNKIDFLIQFATPIKDIASEFVWRARNGKEKAFVVYKKSPEETANLLTKIYEYYKNTDENDYLIIRENAMKIALENGFERKYTNKLLSIQFQEFMKYDLLNLYKSVNIPTLYIISKTDDIINPIENLRLLKEIDNSNIITVESNGLGHYLSAKKTVKNQSIYYMENESKKHILDFIKNIK
jgi:pimeloyl-ACP methyl ester carboxylesterase